MNTIINILKSPKGLAALGAILLVALIVFLGGIFGVSWLFRIIIIVFILLIVLVIFMYKKMKNAQKANQIEKSIGMQADAQMKNLSPEKRAEIEQFKKQLEAAITSLKNSKLAKSKLGKSALYALPWYMIIGPSAAGKTTAIQNSGLEFPFGKEGFKGVGGTRNCDWFFSTKAIFLDTAGRYVTQTEDRVEWLAFLDVLKKNRRRKPVNGVVIALNIDEIINCDKDELFDHAKNIRTRIDELIENLGINFPVYFVFTKCDLVQGFVEYFGDFSEIERSQIWGATLTSQQLINSNPKDVFENEFQKLSDKIFEIRTIRLSSPLKREQRRKVFLFPFQFKSLKQKLTHLIGEVFQHNPYQDNPIFRGFYFTSGTQEGAPLDIAIKEIAKQFNLAQTSDEDKQEILETKNYFIKDLLNDIVIGDQNYSAGQTSGAVKKQSFGKLVTVSASALFLILFCLFTIIGYNGNSDLLGKIKNTSESFQKINWNQDLLHNFTETERLRMLIKSIENGEANESFISFGFDRSEETLPELKQLYIQKTENFFTQYIFDEIVRSLNNYANGQDYPAEEIYSYLKAYLLLGNQRSRLDTTEQRFLAHTFFNVLNTRFIVSNQSASSANKDSLKNLLRNYISFYTSHLTDKNIYPVRNDNLLISIVRDRIQYKPNPESIYARLKQNGLSQFPNELTLEKEIGGGYTFLKTDFRVPVIFTADGWKNYIEEVIIEESINPGKEDWVLGKSFVKPAGELSSEEIKKNLLNLYFNDYKQTWLQFLENIQYTNFETVPEAAANLKILSDPVNSPVVLILRTVSNHLQVIVDIQFPPDSDTKSLYANLDLNENNLNEIKRYLKFASTDLSSALSQFGIISGVLESIKGGQDLAKDYAAKVLDKRSPELSTSLQVLKGTLYNTPALQNLFSLPIKLSWNAILSDASQYINQQWRKKVFDEFNKSLAGSFPFNESGSDAPFEDFKDFFKPADGTIWSFFNNELSAFINKERWKANEWENVGLNISVELMNALKKADDISSTLFKTGDLSVAFKLKPQLPESKSSSGQKPIVEQVNLYIDGVEEPYRMGSPFWKDYFWPGAKGTPGARLNISMRNLGTDIKAYNGEWAFFKLLNDASISRGESSSQYNLNWFFAKSNYDITVSYLLNAGSSRNPFSKNFFTSFNLPGKIN